MKVPSHKYIPDRCDLVWIDFDPAVGKEIQKRRPAFIISPEIYNKYGLCLLCPATSQIKGYPYEVLLPDGKGVVLADQIKSYDWRGRNIQFIKSVPQNFYTQFMKKLSILLES
jgi:mRNA interferase MazF